jgi:SAM-dependent methyltransferase
MIVFTFGLVLLRASFCNFDWDSAMSVRAVNSSGWSASLYNKNASFVYSASYTNAMLQLLDAKPRERIFEFGCGNGEVTLQIAEIVGSDGLVIGVDLGESIVSHSQFLSSDVNMTTRERLTKRKRIVSSMYSFPIHDSSKFRILVHGKRTSSLTRFLAMPIYIGASAIQWCFEIRW